MTSRPRPANPDGVLISCVGIYRTRLARAGFEDSRTLRFSKFFTNYTCLATISTVSACRLAGSSPVGQPGNMEIKHTFDNNGRPASFGVEKGIPWLEFRDGAIGRTLISGVWEIERKRMLQEIRIRGIKVNSDFASSLDALALAK